MRKYIIVLFLAITLTSCEGWLNINPYDKVGADNLFSEEKGYEQALTGVYARMSKANLYGVELSFGMTDLLAKYWVIYMNNNPRYAFSNYDYTESNAKSTINEIWYDMYRGIAETNRVLEALGDENKLKLQKYDLFKGEALALRAFLHWELLEYFGPLNYATSEKKSIPFRDEYSNKITSLMAGKAVFARIKNDLETALVHFEKDPIRGIKHISEYHKSDGGYATDCYLERRNIRMNYYSVKALLARLYLVEGKKQQAYNYATEIINEKKFTLVDEADLVTILSKKDLHYSDEIIFSLYMNKQQSIVEKLLGYEENLNYSYYLFPNQIEAIYGSGNGSMVDYRYTFWFDESEILIKYKEPSPLERPYIPEIPILRLSELYYIAAEAKIGVDNEEALSKLNEVRENRNIQPLKMEEIISDAALLNHIVLDMRKDFIGEGKMFKTYKRLNMDILNGNSKVEASERIFVLPIPEEELEAGKN